MGGGDWYVSGGLGNVVGGIICYFIDFVIF